MKKEYKKPISEILEMEVQQMICQSLEYIQSLKNEDEEESGSGGLERPVYNSVFD